MVYQLKLLIAVGILAFVTALISRAAFQNLLSKVQYFNAWKIVGTAIAVSYLSRFVPVYFVGVFFTAIVAYRLLGKDIRARISAFLMLTMLFPPVALSLGGVGDINHLFVLTHVKALSLVLLAPAAIQLFSRKRTEPGNPFRFVDICLLLYKLLEMVLQTRTLTLTADIRLVFEDFIAVFLPYYTITRGLRSMEDLRFAITHLMIGLLFLAGIGCGESLTQHSMYAPLAYIYDVKWQLTHELLRGGLLRVQATTTEPIALATLMIVALAIWTWLIGKQWRDRRNIIVIAMILGALVSTWSRGPWLCTGVFFVSLVISRYTSSRVYTAGILACALAAVTAKITGADEVAYDFLKTLFGSGEGDFATIEYRRQLLDASIALIRQSPVFGVPDYGAYLQQFRQGEGIIDLVNTYLIVALDTGLVGLALFFLPVLTVFFKLVNRLAGAQPNQPHDLFARCFASLLLAFSCALFMTSMIGIMDQVLLALIALPLVYIRQRDEHREPRAELAPPSLRVAPYGT